MKTMKRLHKWMLLAAVIVTCVGLTVFRYVDATGDATFALAPTSGTYQTGNTISVAVSETSSGADNTNAVQVNLSFPASLTWQSTTLTGPFTLCAQNSHTATSVSIACASSVTESGSQPIATVSFTAASAGSPTVAMTSGSDIDSSSGTSVFGGVLPHATYTVTSSGPAPTPTPTSNPTPTPAHTPTPTPSSKSKSGTTGTTKTPSPSATPSASPTPSKSASPMASPSASPVPASNGSVSITVLDSSGTRVTDATVDFDGQFGQTNSDGVANFAGVSSGSHSVTITANGEKAYTTTVTLTAGENKLATYTLTKAAAASTNWPAILIGLLVLGLAGGATFWYLRYLKRPIEPTTNLVNNAPQVVPPAGQPNMTMPNTPVAPTTFTPTTTDIKPPTTSPSNDVPPSNPGDAA
jgi:hypothetical protein